MKKIISTTAVALAVLTACSSSDDESDGNAGCGDITGNYNVKVTTTGGDCPPGDGKDVTLTITTINGALNLAVPGIEGGCPADLNKSTCKLTAICKVVSNGQNVALINYDYTFAGSGFTGTVAGSLRPPIADPACTATARHVGSRLR